jgi:hypothetical protein
MSVPGYRSVSPVSRHIAGHRRPNPPALSADRSLGPRAPRRKCRTEYLAPGLVSGIRRETAIEPRVILRLRRVAGEDLVHASAGQRVSFV